MTPTQEQVIAWAQEACGDPAWEGGVEWVWGEVRRFAALAYEAGRKDENEACAKVCEEIAGLYSTDIFPEDGTSIDCNSAKMGRVVTKNCAQSIRARREQ